MAYKNGRGNHKSWFLLAALLAASIVAADGPVLADPGLLGIFQRNDAPTHREKARADRAEAVEKARAAFAKADAAGAERAAPYEYYTAKEYLDLAIEELAAGDKIAVALFAAESEAFSFEALEIARGGSK